MEKKGKWFISGLLLVGFVIGIVFVAVFVKAIQWAGSTEFCGTFCHSMDAVYLAYQRGQHGRTPSGVTAGCSDCHLKYHSDHEVGPVTYVAMLYNKVLDASSSAWGEVRDTMNTPQKQIDMRPILAKKVHEHMLHQGFSTCQGCHDFKKMYNPAKPIVANIHKNMEGKTVDCLACHPNVGHVYTDKPAH